MDTGRTPALKPLLLSRLDRFLHRKPPKTVLLLSTPKLYHVFWLEHLPGSLPPIPKLLRRCGDKPDEGTKSAWVSYKTLMNPTVFHNWGLCHTTRPAEVCSKLALLLSRGLDQVVSRNHSNQHYLATWWALLSSLDWCFSQKLSPFSQPLQSKGNFQPLRAVSGQSTEFIKMFGKPWSNHAI